MSAIALSVLNNLSFGSRIAEDERDALATYFVKTDQWRQLSAGSVDIVYGAKGSGKSALYFLLLNNSDQFAQDGVQLIEAENPRGATVFRDLATQPPASEQAFVNLWKLYFLALIGRHIESTELHTDSSKHLIYHLRDLHLLDQRGGLQTLLRTVRDYVSRISGFEGGIKLDTPTLSPALTGKILFENPSHEERSIGLTSVDELFHLADDCLAHLSEKVWILLDRLDVAFAETPELEQNALRALFKAYRDIQSYSHIALKIFLRSDIWSRLKAQGFREASHITRTVTIMWDRASLLKLIVNRSLQNADLRQMYVLHKDNVHSSQDQQLVFDKMFPDQVDSGPNKPKTLDWLLSRTQDGSRQTAPRELIHLLNSIRFVQNKKIETGEQQAVEVPLFSRQAIKEGLPEVSRVRLEQTLYAEYPSLRSYCEKLRGEKTQQSPETLARMWNVSEHEALSIARQLVDVGFFEERGSRNEPDFWVPFLYRDYLDMVQGTATND